MTQEEIYNFLKKHPNKWLFASDIAREAGYQVNAVRRCLKKLKETEFIRFEIGFPKKYKYKK